MEKEILSVLCCFRHQTSEAFSYEVRYYRTKKKQLLRPEIRPHGTSFGKRKIKEIGKSSLLKWPTIKLKLLSSFSLYYSGWFLPDQINLFCCVKLFLIWQINGWLLLLLLIVVLKIDAKLGKPNSNKTVINEIQYQRQKLKSQVVVAELLNTFFTEVEPKLSRNVENAETTYEEFLCATDKEFAFEETMRSAHIFSLLSKL